MADKDEYNGWANHMTWLVKLHLDNTQRYQAQAYAIVASCAPDDVEPCRTVLKDYVEGLLLQDVRRANFLTDVITSALDDVDWREIIKAFRDELA